jgi:phosphoserine phosphatase
MIDQLSLTERARLLADQSSETINALADRIDEMMAKRIALVQALKELHDAGTITAATAIRLKDIIR